MFLKNNSQSLFGECRTMPGILIDWFLYIGFTVFSTRCHKKVLPIYRFLYMGFCWIPYQVSHKRFFQSTSSYIREFSFRNTSRRFGLLSTTIANHYLESAEVCRASLFIGSYIWVLVYCLPGVTENVLSIYRFLYMGFSVLCSR